MGSLSDTIPLGRFLWERIHQVGVNRIFGVPGDFNLTLLDHVYDVDGLEWVGNTNELNAAYAADGYARVKDGAGCLVTTHGVGELSAMNGVAGAMTEQVKLIHVVGQTSRKMQEHKMMIHHSIGSQPDHQMFNKASQAFRVAAAEIMDEKKAPAEIDRVIRECFVKSCPVYIFLPTDLVDVPVPRSALDTPLNLDPEADEQSIKAAVEAVLERLYSAKNPVVFVDCLTERHNAVAELKALLDKLQLPIYTSNMGKGIIDENHPLYVSVYNGSISAPGVSTNFENSDLPIIIGELPSDTNSGGFTRETPKSKCIFIDPAAVKLPDASKTFSQTPIKRVLTTLTKTLDPSRLPSNPVPTLPSRHIEDDYDSPQIVQSYIWHRLARFLRPHDIIFGETGTAAFGLPDAIFPPSTKWITQTYYGSIGYATPAAFGAEAALRELTATATHPRAQSGGRTILVTGDGSLMLTVQEIGNMVKQQQKGIVIVINNAGYTIERVIHGARQSYNDIVPFDYSKMLQFFNMPEDLAKEAFHRATTRAELDDVLERESLRNPQCLQVVEVVMDMMDVPWRLSSQIATRGPEAVKEMKEAGFKVREMQKL
ncbi:hypothetical protein MBLNU230_g0178t1 [Neophaeotheca triangularis]